MKKPWVYVSNVFLNVTKESYVLAIQISAYHDNVLFEQQGISTEIDAMYASYHPIHLAFKADYDEWVAQGGLQKGQTLNLKQLLKLLSTVKINDFETEIRKVYAPGSPEFVALFPRGHKPFQQGKQIERVGAVNSLVLAIGSNGLLAAAKAIIEAFYTLLNNAYNAQKGSKGNTKGKSTDVELSRVEMCMAQFANLGGLIQLYAKAPEKIEKFFDLEAIRNHKQLIYTGHIAGGATVVILTHTFAAGETFTFTLSEDGGIALSDSPDVINGTKLNVTANTPTAINVNDFNVDLQTHRYVLVVNSNGNVIASYKLELI